MSYMPVGLRPKPKSKPEQIADRNRRLKAIWRSEGVDAALGCVRYMSPKMTKRQAWAMITRWMFK